MKVELWQSGQKAESHNTPIIHSSSLLGISEESHFWILYPQGLQTVFPISTSSLPLFSFYSLNFCSSTFRFIFIFPYKLSFLGGFGLCWIAHINNKIYAGSLKQNSFNLTSRGLETKVSHTESQQCLCNLYLMKKKKNLWTTKLGWDSLVGNNSFIFPDGCWVKVENPMTLLRVDT